MIIDLRTEESEPGEWPAAISEDLADIVQVDISSTNRRSVALRTRYAWSEEAGDFEPSWEFLDVKRQSLVDRSARRVNLERFWRYLPVFYLGALRDVGDDFSPRSQFWGRLLKALEIPAGLESRALRVLDLLNQRLLKADTRLRKIAKTLSGATRISARDREGGLDLRMVPLKMWDLISRAEVILRNEPDSPWLPLRRQGQGIQSLSIIFLFQAFVDHVLRELYEPDSEPVLALEEPERTSTHRPHAPCGVTSGRCPDRRSLPPTHLTSCSTSHSGICASCASRRTALKCSRYPRVFQPRSPRSTGLKRSWPTRPDD